MKVFRLGFLCLIAAAGLPAGEPVVVEQIIAKVNGDIITRSDLARARQELEASLRQRNLPPSQIAEILAQAEKDLLRDKIDNLLLIQRGKELNLNVDGEVSKYLAQIQSDNKIADPEKFQAWIRENTGMSYEDFRAELRNNFLSQRVLGQEVYSKVNIPRRQIEEYYEKNKESFRRNERVILREILVSTQGMDEAGVAAAEKKAREIVARARKGERFTELVREFSEGASARQGGLLDPFEKGILAPELEQLVWDKEKGYVTDPIRVPAGWLILRVEDHQKEGLAELSEVENEIREKLASEIMMPRVREFLSELRRNSFIEIRQPWVDTGAVPGQKTDWNDPALLRAETVTKEEVAAQARLKRLLFFLPIPGTSITDTSKSSSK
ncbi:MAG: peptidylprolyl isomerase [Bryobacteraceae bacterium]